MNKIYRLKKNHDIANIVQKRQRISKENYIVYYQYTDELISKVAISVSKKYGIAVERNKAKRIVRSILFNIIKNSKNLSLVVVIKQQAKDKKYAFLEKELLLIVQTIITKNPKGEKNENKKNI